MDEVGHRVGLPAQWLQVVSVETGRALPLLRALGREHLPLLGGAEQQEEVTCGHTGGHCRATPAVLATPGPAGEAWTLCPHWLQGGSALANQRPIPTGTCMASCEASSGMGGAWRWALTDEVGGVGDTEEVGQVQPLDERRVHGDGLAPAPRVVCGRRCASPTRPTPPTGVFSHPLPPETQLGSGVAMAVAKAGSCSSDWTPSLRPSMCCKCSPEKQKKRGGTPRELLLWCSWESNSSSSGCYRGAGVIPGLCSGLKNLVLPQLQLRFSPWPGPSLCCRRGCQKRSTCPEASQAASKTLTVQVNRTGSKAFRKKVHPLAMGNGGGGQKSKFFLTEEPPNSCARSDRRGKPPFL